MKKVNLQEILKKHTPDPDMIMTAVQDWQKEKNCAPTKVAMQEFIPVIVDLYTQLLTEQTKEKTDAEKELSELRKWVESVLQFLREVANTQGVRNELKQKANVLRWKQEIK